MLKIRINPVLLVSLIVLIGVNLLYLAKNFIPMVDTLVGFHIFFHFYNEFFHNGQIAGWLPYGNFGGSSEFLFLMQAATSHFAVLLGKLCRISDVLSLYKWSIVIDQILFLTGVYLLSTRLFRRKSSVLFTCLASIGSTVWYSQYFLDLRIFYLLPLAIYLLLRFFEESNPKFLWLCGITFIAWFLDGVYAVILWAYLFLILSAFLSAQKRTAWKSLFRKSPGNYLAFFVFLLMAGIVIYYQTHSLANVSFNVAGRDSLKKTADLNTFLTYGGNPSLTNVIRSFLFGWPTCLLIASPLDNVIYIGILPLLFFAWALLKERDLLFWGITACIAALIALSQGGLFAKMVYHLPGMSYYRHIGLIYGLVKVLIIIAAGFGWEKFWSSRNKILSAGLVIAIWILLGTLSTQFPMKNLMARSDFVLTPELIKIWHFVFIGRLFVYAGALVLPFLLARFPLRSGSGRSAGTSERQWFPIAFLIAFVFDLFSFQAMIYAQSPKVAPEFDSALSCFKVNALRFQSERYQLPVSDHQIRATKLMEQACFPENLHTIMYNFIQLDPARSFYRSDWWSPGALKLSQIYNFRRDNALKQILGIESPKLRLIPNAVYLDNENSAWPMLLNIPNIDQVVLLPKRDGLPPAVTNADPSPAANGTIRVLDFNANKLSLDVTVAAEKGSWLVYADAWHPGWHAFVDGKEVPVEKAYFAFKAVRLGKGRHLVEFKYWNGLMSIFSYVIAIFSVIYVSTLLIIFLALLFQIRISLPFNRKAFPEKNTRPSSPTAS